MEQPVREDSLEQRYFAAARATRTPVNGSLELTPLCCLNCRMCYVRLEPAQMDRKLLKPEQWLEIARQLRDEGTLFLLLTGGEPLLYPGFRQLYQQLRQMGFLLTINTNGVLIDESWADFFAANLPRRLNITLYGATDSTYETLCAYPGGFAAVKKALYRLKARSLPVKLSATVTKENVREIQTLIALSRELEMPMGCDTYLYPVRRERTQEFDRSVRLSPREAAHLQLEAWEQLMAPMASRRWILDSVRMLESYNPDPDAQGYPCNGGNSSFTVNWQGQLRPCVMSSTPRWDLTKIDFSSAWQALAGQCARFQLPLKCRTCNLRPLCNACPVSIQAEGDTQYLCDYTKFFCEELKQRSLSLLEL